MKLLPPSFFESDPVSWARGLIGARFLWNSGIGRIVETEAYCSIDDPACHTWSRSSARAFVASHRAGDAYVYISYGVTDHLLGAGLGRLTRALGIDGTAHGSSFLELPGCGLILPGDPVETCAGGRIGISRATEKPWRFGDPASSSLSRKF